MQNLNMRKFVENELIDRQKRNAKYSLRAFARDLGVSPTTLSQVINQHRTFSKKSVEQIIDRLGLAPLEAFKFDGGKSTKQQTAMIIADDEFRLISDWFYISILNLAKIKNNKSDPKWVARRLGISILVASDALVRLSRMGFLKVHRGRMLCTAKSFQTKNDIPSSAIRNFHTQNLELAKEAMNSVPIELREFSSITAAISTKNLARAKIALREFKLQLCELLEQGEPDEVYTLALQLFPNTKKEE